MSVTLNELLNKPIGGKLGELAKNGRVAVIGVVELHTELKHEDIVQAILELHEQYKDK